MTVLAVANQKGGVGKTTSAINLGAALAAFDRRVLLIDCDPQANATRGLGIAPRPPHLYDVLVGGVELEEAIVATGLAGLDLVPSHRDLVGFEVEMVGVEDWPLRIRQAIAAVRERYFAILLDCPPSLGHLTVNALTAADGVFVPLQCEYFAPRGDLGTARHGRADSRWRQSGPAARGDPADHVRRTDQPLQGRG